MNPSAGGSGAVPLQPATDNRKLAEVRQQLDQAEEHVLTAGASILAAAQSDLDAAAASNRLAADHITGAAVTELDTADGIAGKWAAKIYKEALNDLNTAEDTINAASVDCRNPYIPTGPGWVTSPPNMEWPADANGLCNPGPTFIDGGETPKEGAIFSADGLGTSLPAGCKVHTGSRSTVWKCGNTCTRQDFWRSWYYPSECDGGSPPTSPPPPTPPPPPSSPPTSPPAPCKPPGEMTLCEIVQSCGPTSPPSPPTSPPTAPPPPPEPECDCTEAEIKVVYEGKVSILVTPEEVAAWEEIAAGWGEPEEKQDGCVTIWTYPNGAEWTETCKEKPTSPPPAPKPPPPPTTPPTPPKPPETPPFPDGQPFPQASGTYWDGTAACQEVATLIRTGTPAGSDVGEWFGEPIGAAFHETSKFAQFPFNGIIEAFGQGLGYAVTNGYNRALERFNHVFEEIVGFHLEAPAYTAMSAASLGGLSWIGSLTGIPMDYLSTPLRYNMQYSCPVSLPSQTGIDGMYMAGMIQQEAWECYTRALGNLPRTHYQAMYSTRSRPNIGERVQQYYRGLITRDDLSVELRTMGVLNPAEEQVWVDLFKQIPTSGDIVRFMVRDSADEAAVQLGGFDTDFEVKFAGILKDWARAQGVDETFMRYIWRSHWELPSPTQLYEMLHRLRPGRVPPELAVTPEIAEQVLKQNDMAPAWVKRLMAVSYHPITLTDVQRGYLAGTISKQDLPGHLEDVGYNRTDAELVAKIIVDDSVRRVNVMTGQWTPREVSKQYREGTITRTEADQLLKQSLTDPDARTLTLDNAETMAAAQRKAKCIKAVRRRFMLGIVSAKEAEGELNDQGVPVAQGSLLVNGWLCELESGRKELSMATLTKLYNESVINEDELVKRLRTLGYTEKNSREIMLAQARWLLRQRLRQPSTKSDYGVAPPPPPKPPKQKAK